MRKIFKYLAIACFISSSAFANFLVITSDQLTSGAHGLYVTINGNSFAVDSVNTANGGFLVAVPTPNAEICPSCGHDTYTEGGFCRQCNFPDDDKYSSTKYAAR